jgi:AcrR family transcriptional regulator
MARTPAFDRATVIRAARTVFWRLGYDGASIPELEQATGLRRSSLYNAFGSKRGLFDSAVQSYLDELVRPRLAPLQAEVVAPEALLSYLTELRDAFENLHSMPASYGCMLINTAGTPLAQDGRIQAVVTDYRRELHSALARGLAATVQDDSYSAELGADVLTALVLAGFAIARVDPQEAAHSVANAIRLVERRVESHD